MSTFEVIDVGYNHLPNVSLFNGPFLFLKTHFPQSNLSVEGTSVKCGSLLKLQLEAASTSDAEFLSDLLNAVVRVNELCGHYIVLNTPKGFSSRRFQMRVGGFATVVG